VDAIKCEFTVKYEYTSNACSVFVHLHPSSMWYSVPQVLYFTVSTFHTVIAFCFTLLLQIIFLNKAICSKPSIYYLY